MWCSYPPSGPRLDLDLDLGRICGWDWAANFMHIPTGPRTVVSDCGASCIYIVRTVVLEIIVVYPAGGR